MPIRTEEDLYRVIGGLINLTRRLGWEAQYKQANRRSFSSEVSALARLYQDAKIEQEIDTSLDLADFLAEISGFTTRMAQWVASFALLAAAYPQTQPSQWSVHVSALYEDVAAITANGTDISQASIRTSHVNYLSLEALVASRPQLLQSDPTNDDALAELQREFNPAYGPSVMQRFRSTDFVIGGAGAAVVNQQNRFPSGSSAWTYVFFVAAGDTATLAFGGAASVGANITYSGWNEDVGVEINAVGDLAGMVPGRYSLTVRVADSPGGVWTATLTPAAGVAILGTASGESYANANLSSLPVINVFDTMPGALTRGANTVLRLVAGSPSIWESGAGGFIQTWFNLSHRCFGPTNFAVDENASIRHKRILLVAMLIGTHSC
jgi:hypothetical protein